MYNGKVTVSSYPTVIFQGKVMTIHPIRITDMLSASRRTRVFATSLAVTAILLGGCTVAPPVEAPDPETPVLDVAAVALPEGDVTAPGSALALGAPAWLPAATLGGEAREVGFSVLGVTVGEDSFWNDFENAEEFAGDTPYFVFVQVHDSSPVGEGAFSPADMLWPIHADGTSGFRIQNQTIGIAVIECPDFTISGSYGPGDTVECFVAVGDGQPIAGASYAGRFANNRTAPGGEPYAAAPVTWLAP